MIRRRGRLMVWVITEDQNGSFSVWKGGRSVSTGLSSQGTAETIVRRNRISGEKVFLAEPDGYRTDLTKKFAEPGEKPASGGRRAAIRR